MFPTIWAGSRPLDRTHRSHLQHDRNRSSPALAAWLAGAGVRPRLRRSAQISAALRPPTYSSLSGVIVDGRATKQ